MTATVLTGQREEWRRILHNGTPHWVRPDGEELVLGAGRRVVETEATYLPPCDPTKILCVHLNYPSRAIEFGVPMGETPTYFQKPTGVGRLSNTVAEIPAPAHRVGHQPTDSRHVRGVALGAAARRARNDGEA